MSSITFNNPLTQEESLLYSSTFKHLDKDNVGVVTGDAVRHIFTQSGLTSQILSQVWATVDTNNKGFLDFNEFAAAMRMIANLKAYPNSPVSKNLYDMTPSHLPNIPSIATNLTGNVANTNSSTGDIPLISHADIVKFSQLFDRSTQGSGTNTISGERAKEIFLKANLSNQTLGEIWAICDRNASGSLEKSEFIVAMYLIQLKMTNNPLIPDILSQRRQIPQNLWDHINMDLASSSTSSMQMNAPLSANSTGLSSNNTGPGSIQRQSTISRLSTGAFTNASADWTLSYDKKRQFDAMFNALDKQKSGSLGADVLVPFFVSSKLNQETLASIWDLADIHNSAAFTKTEFAIAMFLIQKKNSGIDLPDVIPNELLHSPALGLYDNINSNTATPPTQGQIPSRATKPSFNDNNANPQLQVPAPPQQQQRHISPQVSNNGSLNDLMALNNSFSSPPPQLQPISANNTNNSFSSPVNNNNNTPLNQQQQPQHTLKKFTPTSNFGQHIIQEEDENVVQQQQPSVAAAAPNTTITTNTNTASAIPPNPPTHRTASVTLPQVPNFASMNMPSSPRSVSQNIGSGTAAAIGAGVGAIAGAVGAGATSRNVYQNNDLYADADASAKLSTATTDLANLSNQVTSLSKQATMTNDKKSRATQELQRVTTMKTSIQDKLSKLRSTHEQNLKQTEQLESQVATTTRENESLQNELNVVEANFHAIEGKLNELNTALQTTEQENSQLKEKIAEINNQTNLLNEQLQEKQQHVKQERSLVDVNAKQFEVNQITVTNLQKEIAGLDEHLEVYLSKQKELDDYKKTVQEKHAELQTKYEQLATTESDLNERQLQLDERNQQIEEQEKLYHEHLAQLQSMFDDLAQRKESFDKADEDLKRQHLEYASSVQDLSERQMKLAMGELPDDADKIVAQNRAIRHEDEVSKYVDDTVEDSHLKNAIGSTSAGTAILGAAAGAIGTAAALGHSADDTKTEKTESDVFDKDIPTLPSQSEPGENNDTSVNENENMSDRFEGDLNEYGIPRTQSLTSSVANNAPQSVRDDVELPSVVENSPSSRNISSSNDIVPPNTASTTMTTTTEIGDSHIPGDWSPSVTETEGHGHSPLSETTAEHSNHYEKEAVEDEDDRQSESSIQMSPVQLSRDTQMSEVPVLKSVELPVKEQADHSFENAIDAVSIPKDKPSSHPIDEEFPPIQELDIDESDSSDEDFQDTKEAITPQMATPPVVPSTQPYEHEQLQAQQPTSNIAQEYKPEVHDDFEDAFAGLEEAKAEEDTGLDEISSASGLQTMNEPFQQINGSDLSQGLNDNTFTDSGFTTASPSMQFAPQPPAPQQNVSLNHVSPTPPPHAHMNANTPGQKSEVSNDEWDEIFAGFGNSKQAEGQGQAAAPAQGNTVSPAAQQHAQTQQPLTKPPINRAIATTPKSLAVEELSGMGFTAEEATKALERCNWDLEAATNFLLDAA